MKTHFLKIAPTIAAVVVSAICSGCGGGGSSGAASSVPVTTPPVTAPPTPVTQIPVSPPSSAWSSVNVSGMVSNAPISNAVVTAYKLDLATGARMLTLGSARTDASGSFVMQLSALPLATDVVEFSSTGGAYKSALDGVTVTVGTISALLSAEPVGAVSVNVFTDFAARLVRGALLRASATLQSKIMTADEAVSATYGLPTTPGLLVLDATVLTSLTIQQKSDAATSIRTALAGGAAPKFASVTAGQIAGLAVAALEKCSMQQYSANRWDYYQALGADISDNMLDGRDAAGVVAVSGVTLWPTAGTSDLVGCVNQVRM